MQINVTGRHMHVTDPIRAYAEEKIGRIAKVFDAEPMNAELVIHVEKNPANPVPAVAEVTLRMKRARRARRGSGRRHVRRHRSGRRQGRAPDAQVQEPQSSTSATTASRWSRRRPATREISEPEEEVREVVRTKTVDAKPMSEEEAMLQLELLGHDFFVFTHADSERAQRAVSAQRR